MTLALWSARLLALNLAAGATACGGAVAKDSSELNRSKRGATEEGCTYSLDVEVPSRIAESTKEGAPDCGLGDYLLPQGACQANGKLCVAGHYQECIYGLDGGTYRAYAETPYDAWVCECDGTWACWLTYPAASGCDIDGRPDPILLGGANCPQYQELVSDDWSD